MMHMRDPDSPLGLTFGQKLQSELATRYAVADGVSGLTEAACQSVLEVPPSTQTLRNLHKRGRVIE